MFILHGVVVFLSILFGFNGQVHGNSSMCPDFYCRLADSTTNLSFPAPQLLELHLEFCSDLGALNASHLTSLSMTNCSKDSFKIEYLSSVKNISRLQLQHGNLTVLQDNEFIQLSKLKVLDLEGNSISSISKETFRNLTQLKRLNLQNNKIKILPEKVFQPLENLQFLDLSLNGITNFTKDLLDVNRNLQTLLLKGNPLIEVDFPDFNFQLIDLSHCLQLKELKLFSKVDTLILENSAVESLTSSERINQIKAKNGKLKDLQLKHKDSLIELDLQGSRLGLTAKNLSEYFCNMWSLERVDLSNNSLEALPQQFNILTGEVCLMPSLKFLNLSGNLLASFPKESYLIGPHLSILDLAHNRLKNVTLRSLMVAESSLQSLRLAGNQLTAFDYHILSSSTFKNLKEISLHDNRFEESFYEEMAEYLKARNTHIIENETIQNLKKDCPEKPKHEWSVYDILMVVFLVGVVFYVRSKIYRREGDNCCFGINWKRSRNSPNETVSFMNNEETEINSP